MLGNQLRGEALQEWERILKNDVWASQNDNVLSALRLSYQRLSPRLKQCFSHLAIFPKDYQMSKQQIIHLWIAEGFLVQTEGGRDMEELGQKFISELVSRSFLQETFDPDDEECFCMHDLINGLAKCISGKFITRMEVDSSSQISPRNRHLTSISGAKNMSSIDEAISKPLALRTLLLTHYIEAAASLRDRISKLLCLRVLSLRGVQTVVNLLDLLGNLKQLRYLDLSHTKLARLPESVCTLYNLQILILYGCDELVELPNNLRRLINLRCLDIRDTPNLQGMPQGMGNLKELRTLPKFFVEKQNGAKIDDLIELQHLQQELSIFNLQNVSETPRDEVLKNKENLEDLRLEWKGETAESEHESVLEKLKPCKSIKRLSIRGYSGTKFANWVGESSYSNIVSISLKGCKYCTALPTLGQLLFLEDLSIKEFDTVSNVGVEFGKSFSASIEIPFSSLKTLHIEDMRQWENWVICDSVNCEWFPKLQNLTIRKCPKLKSISTCEPTLKIFKSLYKLDVEDCPNLKTSDLLAVSSFKELNMSGKGRTVHIKQLPSEMYRLNIRGRFGGLEECNHRMEGNEEIMLLFKSLHFEEINIYGNTLLQSIPLEVLPFLQRLTLCLCDKLESLSASEDPHHLLLEEIKLCPNLTSLVLYNCSNLKSLPQYMHKYFQSLEHLKVTFCGKIESFPGGSLPANLQSLVVGGCDNKLIGRRLQWGLQKLNALSRLKLVSYKGDDLDYFPEQTLLPSSLTYLQIRGFSDLKFIKYEGLQHLTCLSELRIMNCPKIESFSEEGLPSNLQTLHINRCDKLIGGRLNWGLERCNVLSKLHLSSYKGDDLDSFPEKTLLPPTLRCLRIYGFENLKLINYEGLQHLTSLAELEISNCPKLESLPEGLPSSLSVLNICSCPLLEKRCERDKGEDWHKISHISTIKINVKKI